MLIDAGISEAGPAVVSYIKSLGIKKIDYLIATHPHADHIGGMELVVKSFPIGKIYMTRGTTTTETFKDLLQTIKASGMTINTAKAGVTVIDQNGLKISFLAPCGNSYEELNNWSAVTKVQFGNTSFLLTGDAQELSENEMLKSGVNLQADVLKVGHHGSYSSTSPAFLKAVDPKYAVISVRQGNDYGHPHQVTLDKLSAAGVTVYRTDQNGTVVITSDGKNLSVKAW
jgi:beta-lactamase superfamily II metal-dependent hydrolase